MAPWLDAIAALPGARRLAGFWVLRARLAEETSDVRDVIAIYEEAARVEAQVGCVTVCLSKEIRVEFVWMSFSLSLSSASTGDSVGT